MGHIVAIAQVGQGHTRELTKMLFDRQEVGQNLARVRLIGQGINNWDIGVLGKLFKLRLVIGANCLDI